MKKITILLIITCLMIGNYVFAFEENPSDWAESSVSELKSYDVFRDSSFKGYKDSITRKDFIYFAVRLYEMFDGKEVTPNPEIVFKDTDDIYALKGATIGITGGIGNGNFGPEQLLTREQLAVFMMRTIKLVGLEMKPITSYSFSDELKFSDWAKKSIYLARANNIIAGVGNEQFNPSGNASVEVAIVISNRILKENKEKIKLFHENNSDNTDASKEFYEGNLTINFSFGQRTGTYTGSFLNGLPEGYGEFSSQSETGISWTYKGQFKDGQFNGLGETEWSSGQKELGIYLDGRLTPLSETDTQKMIAQPEKYKYNLVDLVGYVFTQPDYYDDGVVVQMYTDVENHDNNVIVYIYESDLNIKKGDVIKISGIVGEVFVGENYFGAELNIPTVSASKYEIISYEQVYPILFSSEVKAVQTQLGYTVEVEKVEVTKLETRVYVKLTNNGSSSFNLYTYNAKIIQNGKQYEGRSKFDEYYPDVQTSIYPGVSTQGILTFPTIESGDMKLILDGSSDDYNENISDYIYDISF